MFMFRFKEIESEFFDVLCHLEHRRKGIQYMSAIINYIFEVIFIYRGGVVMLCMRSKRYIKVYIKRYIKRYIKV